MHLHDGDDEARYLVVKGCVGEGAARSYPTWLAPADPYDAEAVLEDQGIVGWHGSRPDKLFALLGSVIRARPNPRRRRHLGTGDGGDGLRRRERQCAVPRRQVARSERLFLPLGYRR